MITKLLIQEKSKLHELLGYTEIELKDLTILMGPNGVGKSSLLQGLASKSERMGGVGYYGECGQLIEVESDGEYQVETVKARQDNGKYRGYFGDDLTLDLIMLRQSEGQSTMTMFVSRVEKVIKQLMEDNTKTMVMLIDELDSGVSFDNILQIVAFLTNIRKKFPQIQIVMTAHNYEFARVFPEHTFWVPIGKYLDMSEYASYQGLYELHLIKRHVKEKVNKK